MLSGKSKRDWTFLDPDVKMRIPLKRTYIGPHILALRFRGIFFAHGRPVA